MLIKPLTRDFLFSNLNVFLDLIRGWKYCNWTENNFLYELPLKWELSFALYEGDSLRGFCIASNKIADAYYIHLLFISDKARGHSLGKKCLDYAMELSKKHGYKRIELRCPLSNVRALEFYIKNGFRLRECIMDDVSGQEPDNYLELIL